MSDPEILTGGSVPGIIALALLAIILVGATFGRRLSDRSRRARAGRTVEEIWRRLVADRIAGATLWFLLSAGTLFLAGTSEDRFVISYAMSALFLINGAAQIWECHRQVSRGWASVQGTALADRAHRLADEASAAAGLAVQDQS